MNNGPQEVWEPAEPQGWFRWLHDHSTRRSSAGGRISPESESWEVADSEGVLVGTHAWEVGFQGHMGLLEKFWGTLTPVQRGAALAGASEIQGGLAWASTRLSSCELTAVTACELACNAVLHGKIDVLTTILNSSPGLTGEVRRYHGPGRVLGRFSDVVSTLSCRSIDLVLEAALIRKNLPAIRLALDLGANPNIPVWVLARSYNEKHCALSFCLKNQLKEAANLLLAAGANPGGILFCTPNEPLFQAISGSAHAVAIRLLKQGASFAAPDPGRQKKDPVAETNPKKLISPTPYRFFGHFDTELSWAQEAIGSLIPLVPVEEKPCFYVGNGQGGRWFTFLDVAGDDVTVIRHYEKLGLDTRLSAEEFLSVVEDNAYNKLLYLLKNTPEPTKVRILSHVRRQNPSFGSDGPMDLLP